MGLQRQIIALCCRFTNIDQNLLGWITCATLKSYMIAVAACVCVCESIPMKRIIITR